MTREEKIYVAGHLGMVGSAICRVLLNQGYSNLLTRSRSELDLKDRNSVDLFFSNERPKYVFLAAAKVGGILANDSQGGCFIRENLLIQTNVIDAAWKYGAEKLLFLGSSCIYPKFAAQPIPEDALLGGPLEETNLPYAVAKIAGKTMCDAYRKQFGFDAFTVMPCNAFGIGDNFDLQSGHAAACLMRRAHEARISGASKMTAWGNGSPMREMIDVDDLADACVFLMKNYREGGSINAGSSEEISIRELAELIAEITGFKGQIVWDSSKPNGTPRKLMDNRRLSKLGWRPKSSIEIGLRKMYAWYCKTAGAVEETPLHAAD